MSQDTLVEVKHLKEYFNINTGMFSSKPLKAVDDVSFSIRRGETLGLVGESGCGKTTVGNDGQKLQKELGMAIIMITHDLGVVAQMCDEVIVMYAGSICEQGTADEIFYNPKHEYTKGLMRSIPTVGNDGQKLQPITGTPIDLLNMPQGCPFAPRCDAAMKICLRERCQRMQINDMHQAACWVNVKDAMEKEGGDEA